VTAVIIDRNQLCMRFSSYCEASTLAFALLMTQEELVHMTLSSLVTAGTLWTLELIREEDEEEKQISR
jgi:hypothetical protein